MIPTLIPDTQSYATAALAVAAPSSIALASHIHVRWLDHRGVRTIPVHTAVLAVVAAFGVVLLGGGVLAQGGGLGLIAALPLGAVLGLAVIHLDTRISRMILRRRAAGAGVAARPAPPVRGVRVRSAGLTASRERGPTSVSTSRRGTAPTAGAPRQAWRPNRRDTDLRIGLGWLLAVAVLEELVFRGVLVRLALLPPSTALRIAALAGGVLAFAFSHVFFGWGQALAKLPLAVLSVLAVLLTGNVLAAVIGHAVFNGHVWRQMNAAAPAGGKAAT